MELIKKQIQRIMTTGSTTGCDDCYIEIPDLSILYNLKIMLTSKNLDFGFFDVLISKPITTTTTSTTKKPPITTPPPITTTAAPITTTAPPITTTAPPTTIPHVVYNAFYNSLIGGEWEMTFDVLNPKSSVISIYLNDDGTDKLSGTSRGLKGVTVTTSIKINAKRITDAGYGTDDGSIILKVNEIEVGRVDYGVNEFIGTKSFTINVEPINNDVISLTIEEG